VEKLQYLLQPKIIEIISKLTGMLKMSNVNQRDFQFLLKKNIKSKFLIKIINDLISINSISSIYLYFPINF
jgi:hypothetical protein